MVNRELLVEVPRISYGDPTVSFQCKVDVVNKAKPHLFTLYREPFVPGPIPNDLKPFIQLASWSDVHTFDMDTVNSARHRSVDSLWLCFPPYNIAAPCMEIQDGIFLRCFDFNIILIRFCVRTGM